jgi:hypothetical protein
MFCSSINGIKNIIVFGGLPRAKLAIYIKRLWPKPDTFSFINNMIAIELKVFVKHVFGALAISKITTAKA